MKIRIEDIGTGIVALFAFIAFAMVCTSCTTPHGTATPGYWSPSNPTDPNAKFGLLIEPSVGQRQVEAQK